jgi:FHS family L-fucose permease-like MFS transporter
MALATYSPTDPAEPAQVGGAFIKPGFAIGFALVTSLFFLWAIANNFNDILIRQFQKALDLNRGEAGFIQFVFYLGYFTMALPAGMVIRRLGYKGGILMGLALYALGALLFVPAAHVRVYGLFLTALYVLASGAAFLETAANPYIAHFGDPGRAAMRLNLAQSFNGLGAVVAPLLGSRFIFSGVEHTKAALAAMAAAQLAAFRVSEALRVQAPYLVLALVVVALALLIAVTPLPKVDESASAENGEAKTTLTGLFRAPGFAWAVAAQFFYVGAQVGIWSYFIDFTKDVTPWVSERTAAQLLSASLFGFMVGRFFGTWLMRTIAPVRLLWFYAIAAGALVAAAIVLPGYAAIAALGLSSFFMSIMFPTIFSLGVQDLGGGAKLGSSFIIMAIIGGAIFPPLMGEISGISGNIRLAMILPVACFAVIAWFASRGRSPSTRLATVAA